MCQEGCEVWASKHLKQPLIKPSCSNSISRSLTCIFLGNIKYTHMYGCVCVRGTSVLLSLVLTACLSMRTTPLPLHTSAFISNEQRHSWIITAKWSNLGNLTLIKFYYLIYSPYSNSSNCLNVLRNNCFSNPRSYIVCSCVCLNPVFHIWLWPFCLYCFIRPAFLGLWNSPHSNSAVWVSPVRVAQT